MDVRDESVKMSMWKIRMVGSLLDTDKRVHVILKEVDENDSAPNGLYKISILNLITLEVWMNIELNMNLTITL